MSGGLSDVEKLRRCRELGYHVSGTVGATVTVHHPGGREVKLPWSAFAKTPVAKILNRVDRIVAVGAAE